MLAHCNLKQNTWLCVQNNLAFFLLCTALWWQIERRGGPIRGLEFVAFANNHLETNAVAKPEVVIVFYFSMYSPWIKFEKNMHVFYLFHFDSGN